MSKFETRIVAFIDVLGLSSVLKDPQESRRYAEAIDAIISPIVRRPDEPWLVLPHVRTGDEVEVDVSFPAIRKSRVTTISDAILLSVPIGARSNSAERLRRIFQAIRAVYGIQQSLLALGLRTRGGVSLGGLLHKGHFVVGDGLVRAYTLESQIAIYPRVVIDDPLIVELVNGTMPDMMLFRNRVAHIVRQDTDGSYFVDYLSADPCMSGVRMGLYIKDIYSEIYEDLKSTKSDRVRQKLRWMLRYVQTVTDALQERGDQRRSHADQAFSSVYFRDDENLVTYVEKLTGEKIGTSNKGK